MYTNLKLGLKERNKMAMCFTADVMCDGDKNKHICAEWIFGTVQYYNISGTRKIAREKAKQAGWTHKNGEDFCPECSKRLKKS